MAPCVQFDARDPETLTEQRRRFDFGLLQNAALHRFADAGGNARARSELARIDYLCFDLDASKWHDRADVYDAFASAMSFPPGGGRNLDALADWLRDIAEFEFGASANATGTVVGMRRFAEFARRDPALAALLVQILAETARYAAVVRHLCSSSSRVTAMW